MTRIPSNGRMRFISLDRCQYSVDAQRQIELPGLLKCLLCPPSTGSHEHSPLLAPLCFRPRSRATAIRSSRCCAASCRSAGPCWRSRAAPASTRPISRRSSLHLIWQPTDIDPEALASIEAHRAAANAPNLRAPIELDVTAPAWPVTHADAVVSINMIHISPWTAAQGLDGRRRTAAAAGGVLYLYGPFKENGVHTAPSNAAFDASLKARDPQWGVRDIGDVRALADSHGFDFVERVAMPANNLSLVFRRRAA